MKTQSRARNFVVRLDHPNSEKTDVDHSTLSPTELKTITPVKLNFLDAKTETLCKADCTHFSGCARGPWHCLQIERKRGEDLEDAANQKSSSQRFC